MSFVEADEVPQARSPCSTSSTLSPRPAASRAIPAPLIPPPTMARSKSVTALSLVVSKTGPRTRRLPLPEGGREFAEIAATLAILPPRHNARSRLASFAASAMMRPAGARKEAQVDYRNRHVVITGGTGALGSAVVEGLVAAGAVCHVPYVHAAEAGRYPLRDHDQVKLVGPIELTDEAAVARFYDGIPALWASIHLAGGFAAAPIGETTKADLLKQVETNFVTAF